ncbi:hypothetical protein K7432_008401 [Basidiobolus ranarum]|uniref:FAS1 domain-containing protein n=1 Tax=Basidiobolus ranarum TaxID=34480 RepID=A0ABR2WRU6_9FUNG
MQLFSSVILLYLCASPTYAQDASKNIVDNIAGNTNLKTLGSLVSNQQYAAIRTLLSGAGPFTVFAPTDDALNAAKLDTNNSTLITNILRYHVISGRTTSGDIPDKGWVFPRTLLDDRQYVHLPNNAPQVLAISRDGSKVTVGYGTKNATVTQADQSASNGVIHIIDQVLMPPVSPGDTAKDAGLNTLVSEITKTNIAQPINGLQGVTIFAPNDAAFAAAKLDSVSNDQLNNLIKYHIVTPAVLYSTNLTDGTSFTSGQGARLNIHTKDGNLYVNNARIVTPNVLTNNGVVHVIDAVLNPNETTLLPGATGSTGRGNDASNLSGITFVSLALALVAAIQLF